MLKQTIAALKLFFILSLFLIFLFLFGIPNVKKFLRDESFVVQSLKTESPTNPIPGPSIVVCPVNPITAIGWKISLDKFADWDDISRTFSFVCGAEPDLHSCIWDKTYSLEEAVIEFSSAGSDDEFGSAGHFKTDITLSGLGQCHTLENNVTILPGGRSLAEGFLSLTLNSSLDYFIRNWFKRIYT